MSNIYYDGLTGMAKNPVYGHVWIQPELLGGVGVQGQGKGSG